MRNLKKFKQFESKEEFISHDDIKDIFVDIIDKGFTIEFYTDNDQREGTYFFDFKKEPSKAGLGYFDKRDAYGFSNLSKIKEEFGVFDILEDIKHRLNSMRYTIGFEFDFCLTGIGATELEIICHMQTSTLDSESEEDDENDSDEELEVGELNRRPAAPGPRR